MVKCTHVVANRASSATRCAYPFAALIFWAGVAGTAVAKPPPPPAPEKAWITDIEPLNPKQGSLVLHWTPTRDPATGTTYTRYKLPGGIGCSYKPLPGDKVEPGSSGTKIITTTNYEVNVVCQYGWKVFSVQTAGLTAYQANSKVTLTPKIYVPYLK